MKRYLEAYLALGGMDFVFIFIFPLFIFSLYSSLKIIVFKKKTERQLNARALIRFFLISHGFLAVYVGALIILAKLNQGTSPDKIMQASNLCLSLDERIFGVNLAFWMQDKNNSLKMVFDFFSEAMIQSYNLLMTIFSFALIFSLVKNFYLFVRFIFAFTIVVWISFPVWYLIPAYTPANAYLHNYLSYPLTESVQKSLDNYQPNEKLTKFFSDVTRAYGNSPTNISKFANVSTFPSMHIAWSIIIFYFCFKIWKPLLFVIAPYTILNIISTVFTLQHYGVDVFAGILVAFVAIFLSTLIKYKDDGTEISYLIRKELSATWQFYRRSFLLIIGLLKKNG